MSVSRTTAVLTAGAVALTVATGVVVALPRGGDSADDPAAVAAVADDRADEPVGDPDPARQPTSSSADPDAGASDGPDGDEAATGGDEPEPEPLGPTEQAVLDLLAESRVLACPGVVHVPPPGGGPFPSHFVVHGLVADDTGAPLVGPFDLEIGVSNANRGETVVVPVTDGMFAVDLGLEQYGPGTLDVLQVGAGDGPFVDLLDWVEGPPSWDVGPEEGLVPGSPPECDELWRPSVGLTPP